MEEKNPLPIKGRENKLHTRVEAEMQITRLEARLQDVKRSGVYGRSDEDISEGEIKESTRKDLELVSARERVESEERTESVRDEIRRTKDHESTWLLVLGIRRLFSQV